jgi:hypothetical protein
MSERKLAFFDRDGALKKRILTLAPALLRPATRLFRVGSREHTPKALRGTIPIRPSKPDSGEILWK